MTKVYIERYDNSIAAMFIHREFDLVEHMGDADLIHFTGGSDVYPELYGESSHPRTQAIKGRDIYETKVWGYAFGSGIPCVGICRGGQFLNVMNGGKMYQHVDGHAIGGTHLIHDVRTGKSYDATSTHHQMMIPSAEGKVIATGGHLSTFKQRMNGDKVTDVPLEDEDTEVIFYPATKNLCFQPHPEYLPFNHPLVDYYFELIHELLEV